MYNVYFFHCYSFLYREICGLLGPKYLKGGSLPYPTLQGLQFAKTEKENLLRMSYQQWYWERMEKEDLWNLPDQYKWIWWTSWLLFGRITWKGVKQCEPVFIWLNCERHFPLLICISMGTDSYIMTERSIFLSPLGFFCFFLLS